MKEFNYVIEDELGIHAGPAGLLAKEGENVNLKLKLKSEK